MAPRKKAKTQTPEELFPKEEFSMPAVESELPDVFAEESNEESETTKEPEPEVEAPEAPKEEPEEKPLDEATKKKYLNIFDTIMFEGSYSKVADIGKKYKVLFRTRTSKEDLEISLKLDSMTFNTVAAYQNQASLLTLSYSLQQCLGRDLSVMSLSDRYKHICGLPSALISLLAEALIKFDTEVAAALRYGQENF